MYESGHLQGINGLLMLPGKGSRLLGFSVYVASRDVDAVRLRQARPWTSMGFVFLVPMSFSLHRDHRSPFSRTAARQVFVEGDWDNRSDAGVGHDFDRGESLLHLRTSRAPRTAESLSDQRDLKTRKHRRVTCLGLVQWSQVRTSQCHALTLSVMALPPLIRIRHVEK